MNDETLIIGTSVDLSGWDKGIASLQRQASDFERDFSKRSFKMPTPTGGAGSSSGTNDAAKGIEDVGAALVPLGQQIKTSITAAMAPLNSFASRFGAQFDAVGGTILALARRIDEHLKFPAFEQGIAKTRAFVAKNFVDMEGDVTKFGRTADRVLGALSAGNKLKNFAANLGDIGKKGMGEFNKIKAPKLNFDQSTTSILNVNNAAQKATSSLKGMFAQFALAVGAVGLTYKLVGAVKDGIQSAMDLGETVSKVQTVFAGTSDSIIANADKMASAFGLPKQAILDASAAFGLIGKAAGYNGQQTAQLSTQMANLAADVSSFYNIPLDEALNKIRSGLVGEAEPMRSLGVLLSESAVKAEAFRLGLVKAGEDLSEQAKVQARASLITKGLADATGDLERTQGSSANQARKFTGTIANLTTSIGEALLPAVNKGLGLLNEFASFLASSFKANKSALVSWYETVGSVFDTIGIVFRNWQDTFEIARLSIYQGLVNLGERFEVLGPNIATVAGYIAENWTTLLKDGFNATLVMLQNFWKNFQDVGKAIGNWFADPTKGFQINWTPLLDGFKATAKEFPALLEPKLTDMGDEIAKHQQNILDNEAKRQAKFAGSPAAKDMKRGIVDTNPAEKQSAKDLEKLQKFAESFKDKTRTAFEKYNEAMSEAKKAYDAGLLSKEDYARADQYAMKEAGLDGEKKFSGAMELGSKDAYSTILAATTGRSEGFANLEKLGQQQVTALNVIATGIENIAKKATAPKEKVGLMG